MMAISTSKDEAEGSGLLGVIISGKSLKTIVWPAAAWICNVTCVEKRTSELLVIKFAKKDSKNPPTWRVNYQIRILTSPPRVCPSSRFVGEGDYSAKNLMVTQRCKGFRQVRAAESVTPYVLCSRLY
jgi:hypothetical protein